MKWSKKVFANDKERLGHASVVVPNKTLPIQKKSILSTEMVVFGGVNMTSDLEDVAALIPPVSSVTALSSS